MLVVVCGLPGVGKTTVAERVTAHVGGELLRTDVVRKELFPDPEYTDRERRRVYDELFDRARRRLAGGRPTVLDGTFHQEDYRDRAESVASSTDASIRFVKVECEDSVVRARIENRSDGPSDADFEVHRSYRERFDPLEREHVVVDNSNGLSEMRAQVSAYFEKADVPASETQPE